MVILGYFLGVTALVGASLLLARLAFHPPALNGLSASHALPASDRTALGRAVRRISFRGDNSGVVTLSDGSDAFAARVALIRAAQESVDIQYYIWQRDATGLMLLGEVQRAAERGVRIRLLLDDHGSPALDADLATLDAHPLIEVRLFNPFILRRGRFLGFLFDFARLNRRMHNKSLTADGAATILGGRNIGNIYFGYGEGTHYVDLDVLAVGQIAADVARDFDRYWASGSAHPAARILWRASAGGWQALADGVAAVTADREGRAYAEGLRDRPTLVEALLAGTADLDCVPVTLVSDHPAKGLGRARREQFLYSRLVALTGQPQHSVDLISAYFVPGKGFTRALSTLARRGRRVRVLTNSQQATDVMVVHSAYVRYRPELLKAGVELFEMKADAPLSPAGAEREVSRRAVLGSSRSSLHSKSLCIDERRVFIGSFNFDHRSLDLNTEMGVLIDSPRLGTEIARGFDERVRPASYRPHQIKGRQLVWEDPGPPERLHRAEPDTTWLSRAWLVMLGWLPIEWLL